MKKWMLVMLAIGIVIAISVGGIYYWNQQKLHHAVAISQPTAVISTENENKEKPAATPQGRINILVLGVDNEGNEIARSDMIMLVSATLDTHQVSVISIPRDTRVNIPGVGLTKITHANAVGEAKGGIHNGTLESAKAVSDFLNVPINYYAKINFIGFQKVVDYLGGIDLILPNPVDDDYRNVHLSIGEHHINGDLALRLARARFGLSNGDFSRQQDLYYLLSALAHQMLTVSNIPKLPEELNMIHQELVDTNLSTAEMLTMGIEFKGIEGDMIRYYQLPGHGITAHDPLVGADVYYYEPDMEGMKKVVQEALKS